MLYVFIYYTYIKNPAKHCFCFHCAEVTMCDPAPISGCLLGQQEPADLGLSTEMGLVSFRGKEMKKEYKNFLSVLMVDHGYTQCIQ